jgi:hypothetical protein
MSPRLIQSQKYFGMADSIWKEAQRALERAEEERNTALAFLHKVERCLEIVDIDQEVQDPVVGHFGWVFTPVGDTLSLAAHTPNTVERLSWFLAANQIRCRLSNSSVVAVVKDNLPYCFPAFEAF